MPIPAIDAIQDSAIGVNRRVEAAERRLASRMDGIDGKLDRILEGQAVLLQNDMELKRRLDER